jgi:hypothetical protein
MVLLLDAGHQMKKRQSSNFMFFWTIIGGGIFVGLAWEWKNFIKVNMVLLKQKEVGLPVC